MWETTLEVSTGAAGYLSTDVFASNGSCMAKTVPCLTLHGNNPAVGMQTNFRRNCICLEVLI